jgi:hypothetical protein
MSSHFYDQKGNLVLEVLRSDGKGKRPCTIRDAKKLKLVPSYTTIKSILANHGLDVWKTDQVIKAMIDLQKHLPAKLPWMSDFDYQQKIKEWKGMVLQKSKKIAEDAATRGSEIHSKLELFFQEGVVDQVDKEFIKPALNLMEDKFKSLQGCETEVRFISEEGYGGTVDLINHIDGYILDFKTKLSPEVDKNSIYGDDYMMQLSAYRNGIKAYGYNCFNLLISTTSPGAVYLHQWTETELQKGLKMFNAVKDYWYLSNNMIPGVIKSE